MCNENKGFVRVNGGKNYYCISCCAKIHKSRMDYWKPCSFADLLRNISPDKK